MLVCIQYTGLYVLAQPTPTAALGLLMQSFKPLNKGLLAYQLYCSTASN
jgi:hypothetical protein